MTPVITGLILISVFLLVVSFLGGRFDRQRHYGYRVCDVIAAIQNGLSGEPHDLFDDFLSYPIEDPRLEEIRLRCLSILHGHPESEPGRDFSLQAEIQIRTVLDELIRERQPDAGSNPSERSACRGTEKRMKINRKNEKGTFLGIILIVIAVGLLISAIDAGIESGPFKRDLGTVLVGLYVQYLGLLFLLSYYFTHKSFLFRSLMWVCEHFSMQPGKWNAFLYFGLGFVLGGVAILHGIGFIE